MFKNSSKTKLDFDSGFKALKVIPDGPSSKNIISMDVIFKSKLLLRRSGRPNRFKPSNGKGYGTTRS